MTKDQAILEAKTRGFNPGVTVVDGWGLKFTVPPVNEWKFKLCLHSKFKFQLWVGESNFIHSATFGWSKIIQHMLQNEDAVRVTPEEYQSIIEIAKLAGIQVKDVYPDYSVLVYYNDRIGSSEGRASCKWNYYSFHQFINKMLSKEPKFKHGSKFKTPSGNIYELKQNPCHKWCLELQNNIVVDDFELTLEQVRTIYPSGCLEPVI